MDPWQSKELRRIELQGRWEPDVDEQPSQEQSEESNLGCWGSEPSEKRVPPSDEKRYPHGVPGEWKSCWNDEGSWDDDEDRIVAAVMEADASASAQLASGGSDQQAISDSTSKKAAISSVGVISQQDQSDSREACFETLGVVQFESNLAASAPPSVAPDTTLATQSVDFSIQSAALLPSVEKFIELPALVPSVDDSIQSAVLVPSLATGEVQVDGERDGELQMASGHVHVAPGVSFSSGHIGEKIPGVSLSSGQVDVAPGGSFSVAKCGREESWVCAICHDSIPLANTAQIKECEHHYCANCIIQWCSYKQYPWCPQCRQPFNSLSLFKLLDGSLSDVMVEESVCLLLRAPWYQPVEVPDEPEEDAYLVYDDEDYDEEEYQQVSLRIGNRRWGENGYVRGGRMQARVTVPSAPPPAGSAGAGAPRRGSQSSASRSAGSKGNANNASGGASPASGGGGSGLGRRAKRAQKREQADKDEPGSSSSARSAQQQRNRQAGQQNLRSGVAVDRV